MKYPLVSDYSKWALENYITDILISAKDTCGRKYLFYKREFRNGYTAQSTINEMEYWKKEFLKWCPIILNAKARDIESKRLEDKKWDSLFKKR